VPNVSPQDADRYNEIIEHETIRVAVCDMLENANNDSKDIPSVFRLTFTLIICRSIKIFFIIFYSLKIFFREAMEKSFVEFYPHYEKVVKKNLWLSNRKMIDPFGEERGTFDYNLLLTRLQRLKEKYNVSTESSDLDSESDLDDQN
jgi:ubiquitin-conjugating enzyme E2 Z